jgi:hypothetical protein
MRWPWELLPLEDEQSWGVEMSGGDHRIPAMPGSCRLRETDPSCFEMLIGHAQFVPTLPARPAADAQFLGRVTYDAWPTIEDNAGLLHAITDWERARMPARSRQGHLDSLPGGLAEELPP